VGLRFYRRLHLCPGLSLNVSPSGPSLTVGVRGAHVTVGRTGVRKTVGIPGTGLYYTSRQGYHTGYHSAKGEVSRPPEQQAAADRQAERMLGVIVLGVIVVAVLWLLQ
jgi:Protein of unknown function (DUF4236)